MTGKVVPIELGGGARFNLWEPDPDDPRLWEDTAKDFAVAIRGEVMNRDLGVADAFLSAGEWGLALEELLAVISDDPDPTNSVVNALAHRAKELLAKAERDRKHD